MKLKTKFATSACLPISLAVVAMIAAQSAQSANLYWDVNGTTAGFSTVVGAWNDSNLFWSTSSIGGAGTLSAAPSTSDDLFISQATTNTGSITISGSTKNASSLTFLANVGPTTTITGGTINIGGTGTSSGIFQQSTGNNTINSALRLNSGNTTFHFTNSSTGLLTIGGAVTGTATTDNATQSIMIGASNTGGITLSGVIADVAGSATKVALTVNSSGTGVTTLTGANTYTGDTTINSGTLTLSGNATGTVLNTSGITLNGGILQLTNTSTANVTNRVNDSATITSNGGRINFANTAAASTVYAETLGTVALTTSHLVFNQNNDNTASNSQTLTLSGLTRTGAANTSTVSFVAATTGPNATKNRFVVSSGATNDATGIIGAWAVTNNILNGGATAGVPDYARFDGSGNVVPLGATATSTETSLSAGGNITWSGSNTTNLTATRTLNTLRLTAASNPGIQLANFNLETYGILAAGGGGAFINQGTGSGFLTIPVAGGSSSLFISNAGRTLVVGAAIRDNGESTLTLVKSGLGGNTNGSLTLLNTNNSYSGDTVVNEGDLNVGASNVIPDGAGKGNVILNGSNARLLLTGVPVGAAFSETINGLSGRGAVLSNATSGTSTLTVGSGNADGNFSGTLINGGVATLALTKTGTGTQTLSGVNTYTGATAVNQGTLAVNGTGSINNSASLTINSGATFRYNSSTALTISSANITNNGTIAGSGNLTGITLGGTGSVDPGNSPGILTATATDPSGGLDYNFEMTSAANTLPTWSNAAASGNDVLRLTDATAPFTGSLGVTNVISLYFGIGITPTVGDVFTGGFYTDKNSDFLSAISSATFQYYVYNGVSGTPYNGTFYDVYTGPSISVSTFQVDSANFAGGPAVLNGYVTQFTVVPETSTTLLGALGVLALLRRRRKSEG